MSKIAKAAISIPYRIKRSPTDILKALSKTVNLDPHGPGYSLIDDTLLGHSNPFDIKKSFLAKSSGIRTARMMIDKYPDAFMKDDCDPHISKFFPTKQFTEKELKYPNESLIFSLMSWGKLKQAFEAMQKCKEQNIEVSEECKLALLDLMCIHNSDDFKEQPLTLEAFYIRGLRKEFDARGRPILYNTWKNNAEAEVLFNDLKSKTTEAYCSLIKGMFKYSELEGCKKLYNEMKTLQLIPDLRVLNIFIEMIIYDSELRNDQKAELIIQRLKEIRDYGHTPNLRTFNACLEVIASFGMYQRAIQLSLDILKEMDLVGIKPSLATYSSILEIFYPTKDIGSNTGILSQVIDEVEKMASHERLEWRDLNDAYFFPTAMSKCNSAVVTNLNDTKVLESMKRIHAIFMSNQNIRFANSAALLTRYFESYIYTLLKFDKPENVIKEWRYLTPHIFNRTMSTIEQMLILTRNNGCYEFLLELWTSFNDFRPKRFIEFSSRCIDIMLTTMNEYQGNDKSLIDKFADIAENIMKNFPYQDAQLEQKYEGMKIREYNWTSQMLSNFFKVLLKAKRFDVAYNQFLFYKENPKKIVGELKEDLIYRLIHDFIEANQREHALDVIKFAVTINLPLSVELFNKIENGALLSEENKSLIKQLKKKYNV